MEEIPDSIDMAVIGVTVVVTIVHVLSPVSCRPHIHCPKSAWNEGNEKSKKLYRHEESSGWAKYKTITLTYELEMWKELGLRPGLELGEEL